MASNEEIGRRIRQARKELGMTQQQLGKLWGGKSHAAISNIERGATPVSASGLAELADILGRSTSYFYGSAARAQFLRGGRDENGAVSGSDADAFRRFLGEQESGSSE